MKTLHSARFLGLFITVFATLQTAITAQDKTRFSLLSKKRTGIDFVNKIKDTKEANIFLYANYYGGAGVGVGDFNNDGLQDIYFAGNLVDDRLYFNKGNFEFQDVTNKSGIKSDGGWSTGVTVTDVNNDGFLDIYVSRELYDDAPNLRKNLLYINQGDGTFKEEAEKYGVANDQRTRHATFLDFDKDGTLDLFLLTQPPNPGSYSKLSGTELLLPEFSLRLYKNMGDHFVDVTEKAGLNLTGFPNAVSASDFNNDGWTDLYVANDFYAPDFLFINNADGTFTNIIDTAMNHIPYYSMGVDAADIDNDMLLDIFVVDMVAEDNFRLKSNMSGMNPDSFWQVVANGGHYQYMYNALQLNNGNNTFSDIAQFTGMAATDWSWSNLIADFDNDGLKDTYITNGLLHDIRNTDADKKVGQYITDTANKWVMENPDGGNASIWDILDLKEAISILPSQPIENYAFKNNGNLNFEKITAAWGLNQASFSNGSAYADFDNDGDLDIVVNNINESAFIYENNSELFANANFLRIALEDEKGKSVFGIKIKLYASDTQQYFETSNVRGIYSTSESIAHFGLGNHQIVDSILVRWPNDTETVLKNVKANQTLKLKNTSGKQKQQSEELVHTAALFKETTSTFPIKHQHQENTFNDFDKQVLLPHKLSQFGPALAKGDVNNDGLEDLYIGGATGYEAALYIQQNDGSFVKDSSPLWSKEAVYEDIDALFIDITGDGFLDLYVVSGGNEYPVNDPHYIDRFYVNDGKGTFSKGAILNADRMSGATVKAGDFDNDGDVDLFVGARHIPHQYPLPASSMLLENQDGQLINVTNTKAPELKNVGMVTDAIWMDYDNDSFLDLILVGEWMPISVFKNKNGILVKEPLADFENTEGWWFSIEKGDFDNDGDMDIIVGNLGLNYKYKTSIEEPFDIYFNDFDNNGQYDIVLGYYNDEKHYPLRGFSCSSDQIPSLKQEFQKYDLFASLQLNEIYGEQNLENSIHYKAHTFASYYIENLGNASFKLKALPNMAQLSNINDVFVDDFNNDGHLDILLAGNLFVSEIETPRNDAGTGLVMLGNGKGDFQPISPIESGFFANKDAKKIVPIIVNQKKQIIVGNNDEFIQVFEGLNN
ncbi:VCBS repeat-containing protein [Arenibacter sp. GZD96]|uniref:VCBS repeat-containing protein n=1 Tax=Aurantibrevibacter litoralis TaxID=3106030 RepID=UPI002AFE43F7|nr:VCBS repeat-containing protein [Arenibacter sp. GZD-96]MEA1784821.1 VCBS repeat-containing protein [Arenibacter sp. GZD-96]